MLRRSLSSNFGAYLFRKARLWVWLVAACGRFAFDPELYIYFRSRLGWAWGRLGLCVGPLRPLRVRKAWFGPGLRLLRPRSRNYTLAFGVGWVGLGVGLVCALALCGRSDFAGLGLGLACGCFALDPETMHLRSASVGSGLGSAWFARRPFASGSISQGPVWVWLATASLTMQKLYTFVRLRLSWAWVRLGLNVGPLRPFQFRRALLEYGLRLLRLFSRIIHSCSALVGVGLGVGLACTSALCGRSDFAGLGLGMARGCFVLDAKTIHLRSASIELRLRSAWFARWPFAAVPISQGSAECGLRLFCFYLDLSLCVRRRLSLAWGRLGLRVGPLRQFRFRRAWFGHGLRPTRFWPRSIHFRWASVGLGLGPAWFVRWPLAAAPISQGLA
jgi:hypothetical protein